MEFVLYIATTLAILLAVYAQIKVSATFRKYSSVPAGRGYTAADIARMILDNAGLYNVRIERVGGNLTDHYDPSSNVLRLSDSVHDGNSAAAVGVAAHEAGHAMQYAENYFPVKLRSRLVPLTGFASKFTWIIILLGTLVMAFDFLIGYYVALVGIGLFSVTTIFQLVTLPCEFNASRRALASLDGLGMFSEDDLSSSKRVLSAAAMTYVAGMLVSLLQLLRLIVRFSGNRRR